MRKLKSSLRQKINKVKILTTNNNKSSNSSTTTVTTTTTSMKTWMKELETEGWTVVPGVLNSQEVGTCLSLTWDWLESLGTVGTVGLQYFHLFLFASCKLCELDWLNEYCLDRYYCVHCLSRN